MSQAKDRPDSPPRDPGMPDDQTPAIDHPGEYAADKLKQKDSSQEQGKSQGSQQGEPEGSPNQGTESR